MDGDRDPVSPLLNLVRWLLVALTLGYMMLDVGQFVAQTANHDLGRMGFSTDTSTFIVGAVEPGSPAAKAGIQPGDGLRFGEMNRSDQLSLLGRPLLTSDVVHLVYGRQGKEFRATLHAAPVRPNLEHLVSNYTELVTVLFVGLLILAVLVRRPSTDAIALWLIAENWVLAPFSITYRAPDWITLPLQVSFNHIIAAASVAALVVLALRVSGDWALRQRFERFAWLSIVPMYLIYGANDFRTLLFAANGKTTKRKAE